MTNNTVIAKDAANRKMIVTRPFNAPIAKVWKAWTTSSLLDQWWAPKPWKAETKSMDFREGGSWLYCMVGPDGTRAWCRVDYKTITTEENFSGVDLFCDEHGNRDNNFPQMKWLVEFKPAETGSIVQVTITFDSDADMQKIIEMGFEAGFTMGLGNLEELLEA